MLIFLFLLLFVGLIIATYFHFSSKIDAQRKQTVLLAKQNNDLRKKISENTKGTSNLTIRYLTPDFKNASIKNSCFLYFYPLDTAPQLLKIDKDAIVEVHDSADVSGALWYEVSIFSLERINNKGWVKENDIIVL